MTAQDLVTAAYRQLNVIGAGQTPSTDESNVGLEALNQMVATWNDAILKSLAGSYSSVIYTFTALPTYATLGATVSVPASWQKPMVLNLAIDLAGQFGRPIEASLAALATQAKQAIVTPPQPVLP